MMIISDKRKKNMKNSKLAVVIPCYNEQEMLEHSIKRMFEVLDDLLSKNLITADSYLLLVDDGSTDKTWDIIEKYHSENSQKVKGVKFAKNFGNQNALIAGLTKANEIGCDCAITIDADLQQDENKIEEFVQKFQNGNDIVMGVRKNRNTDGFIKKYTALAFYKLINLLGAKLTPNHSDYRLVSKKVLNMLDRYKEVNLFLRGLFPALGQKTDTVYFEVKPRKYGHSKFTLWGLFSLAMQGITSYSIVPLRLVAFTGMILAIGAFLLGVSVIIEKYTSRYVLPGWATIVSAISFIGGIQVFCLGIIGEYIGQLFQEVKARPRYITEIELD